VRASEFISELEENRARKTIAGVLAAAAMAGGGLGLKGSTTTKGQQSADYSISRQARKIVPVLTNSPKEQYLLNYAQSQGIEGEELAQLMAQAHHETMGFSHMREWGNPQKISKKYDKKFSPRTAQILGNVHSGDGLKYMGRGYLMLTGRDNYSRAGLALGLDLINNPELAANPEIAAKIAVWYWRSRVSGRVSDWAATDQITRRINPAGAGLDDRMEKFKLYSQDFNVGDKL